MTDNGNFADHMEQGAALHAAGQPAQALLAFEKALSLQPANTNAASACATLLTALGQPQAAYQVLRTVRDQLLTYADGATNLAIVAESCGQIDEARAAYGRALQLDPNHLRALNNTALNSARAGDWASAIAKLERCVSLAPGDVSCWLNLADMLTGARRFADAVKLLADAAQRWPRDPMIAVRHAMVLAFDAQIEAAQKELDALGAQGLDLLRSVLAQANLSSGRLVRKTAIALPDAYELFCQQAFDAMQSCDWRDYDRLTAVIREMLARAIRTGQVRDWRDAQFYGLVLPLHEDDLCQIRKITTAAIDGQLPATMPPFTAPRTASRDGRLRVGFATLNLRDPRNANALERQLALHDHARFAVHVYSSTPQPDFVLAERLARQGVTLVEMAHMTNDEAVGRIRLDGLDLFMDMAYYTPWCRPEIPVRRVAPVQIRQCTWHRQHSVTSCQYSISDTFVHPDGIDMRKHGSVVRLPHSCWLSTNDDDADTDAETRPDLGLPEAGLVLCAFLPTMMVDPETFTAWMGILKALPLAVLWLPTFPALARNNLSAAASGAGVDPARLVYLPNGTRGQTLARMKLADLFVDSIRFNANYGLVDALRMGVPAISCAGDNMASRLGGSIIRAAGLPECVFDSSARMVDAALALGRDAKALATLRARLASQRPAAPLFDAQARVREWEWAWTTMVQRHQAGLPPQAFDVPDQTAPHPAATVSP